MDSLKGKYVLLDFWSVYCGPCREDLPHLKQFYDKIDKSKFDMIGVVGDSPAQELSKLIEKYSINWPLILSENQKIFFKYSIKRYPTTILLDKEGVIISKNLRGKKLEEKILSLIDE